MTNRELLERIVGDLNELIDRRGNTQMIPILVETQKHLDHVRDLERMVAAMRAHDDGPDYPDDFEPS